MKLPQPRGLFSQELFTGMSKGSVVPGPAEPADDDDLHIALWVLYEQHYRGFTDVDEDMEWDPSLLAVRAGLEQLFDSEVREMTDPVVADALAHADGVVDQLMQITKVEQGPSLPQFVQRQATKEQYLEFLMQRSLYHRKESDPHSWAIARLDGPPKVALAELQYDEFGAGVPDQLHSLLFAEALEGAGLDPTYGAYVDCTSAATLAVNNVMSQFGLHRRRRGACMGHLAAFEMTSSMPCRRYVQGAQRLELDPRVIRYFDEHVEADAVHEQLALRNICQSLVAAEPNLQEDVLTGAAACVLLEARAGEQMIRAWESGSSSLRQTRQEAA